MSTRTLHPLAADYVDRLRRAGRGLPRGRLKELVAEIEEHLSEAIAPDASEAEALTILDRLGEPEEIVDAEEPGWDPLPADARGTKEWAAIILLLFGGFIFGIGWLAGLILLWSSRAWSTVDKWIGTMIVPGGLAAAVFIALIEVGGTSSSSSCYSYSGHERCTGSVTNGVNIPALAADLLDEATALTP